MDETPDKASAAAGAAKVPSSTSLFPATRWSLVRIASPSGGESAEKALAELCEAYLPAVRVYFESRVKGNRLFPGDEAADITQGFFLSMLRRDAFTMADPEKGSFRQFMQVAARNHLLKEVEARLAKSRPDPRAGVCLEDATAELPHTGQTPDRLYSVAWLRILISRAFEAGNVQKNGEARPEETSKLRDMRCIRQGEAPRSRLTG